HGWSAGFPPTTVASFRHDQVSQAFGLSTTKAPECTVTVSVSDGDTREPIDGAYVRLGLHSGYTDETGVVKVALPKESYELVVWKTKHKMHRTAVAIEKDEDIEVELTGCKVCTGLA
ncbi:MAG: hypothetical protein ABSA72_06220, partial [Nitrososphaerales archaeon]